MSWSQTIQKHSSFNPAVILTTLLFSLILIGVTLFYPEQVQNQLGILKSSVLANFSWFYILAFSIFLFFLVFVAFSGLGSIKLGADEERPEFSFLSWLAMLFAAGMGVGLMFFGVAEPLSHFVAPPAGDKMPADQGALLHTLFHWGIHAWSVYGVIALALAYFSFRYKLPLALRSCFYPLLKEKINGKMGDSIDVLALCATLFGIITTLGFGATQMSAGLQQMGWLDEADFGVQLMVIICVMALAVISAITGVGRGVKILSELNLILAVILMLFVLCTGPTLHLLNAFANNMGVYLHNVVDLSFKTYVYESEKTSWFQGWTVLYWAWWCSWAPFVGLFIARISRGRSIREFVFGVLVVPTVFSMLWFTIFGNTAIWLDTTAAGGALGELTGTPEKLLFVFLDYLPLSSISSLLALVVLALFFVTSADSGIYVLNNIASRDKRLISPRWQTLMWGVVISMIAIVLLRSGGLGALQSMTLVVALPFAALMLVMCASLIKGLWADHLYSGAQLTYSSVFWTGSRWRQRLGQMLHHMQEKDVVAFMQKTAIPAMEDLRLELKEKYALKSDIVQRLDENPASVELIIHQDGVNNFVYGIRSTARQMILSGDNARELTVEPQTYFGDGRRGYDVQYMTREELIADILKQYERYLSLLAHVGQELMAHDRQDLGE